MEWFYGLLIGSTFTALLMHLAHRGHKEEQSFPKAVTVTPPVHTPKAVERGNAVSSLEDVPENCSCDWAGDQRMCEEEPRTWYRTRQDKQCSVHAADDAWLRRYIDNYRGL